MKTNSIFDSKKKASKWLKAMMKRTFRNMDELNVAQFLVEFDLSANKMISKRKYQMATRYFDEEYDRLSKNSGLSKENKGRA